MDMPAGFSNFLFLAGVSIVALALIGGLLVVGISWAVAKVRKR